MAAVLDALVTNVSIAAHFVRTAARWFVMAEGTAVLASAFLTMYQSVLASSLAAWDLSVLIFFVFNP